MEEHSGLLPKKIRQNGQSQTEIGEFETAAIYVGSKVASLIMNKWKQTHFQRDTLLKHAKQPCKGRLSASFLLASVPGLFQAIVGLGKNLPQRNLEKLAGYSNVIPEQEIRLNFPPNFEPWNGSSYHQPPTIASPLLPRDFPVCTVSILNKLHNLCKGLLARQWQLMCNTFSCLWTRKSSKELVNNWWAASANLPDFCLAVGWSRHIYEVLCHVWQGVVYFEVIILTNSATRTDDSWVFGETQAQWPSHKFHNKSQFESHSSQDCCCLS